MFEAVFGMFVGREGDGEGVEWEEMVVAIVAGEAGSDARWSEMYGGRVLGFACEEAPVGDL